MAAHVPWDASVDNFPIAVEELGALHWYDNLHLHIDPLLRSSQTLVDLHVEEGTDPCDETFLQSAQPPCHRWLDPCLQCPHRKQEMPSAICHLVFTVVPGVVPYEDQVA